MWRWGDTWDPVDLTFFSPICFTLLSIHLLGKCQILFSFDVIFYIYVVVNRFDFSYSFLPKLTIFLVLLFCCFLHIFIFFGLLPIKVYHTNYTYVGNVLLLLLLAGCWEKRCRENQINVYRFKLLKTVVLE